MGLTLDWSKVSDASTNFLVAAIDSQVPKAPPTSTPAPLPGAGVIAVGQPQDQGTPSTTGGGIPWMYVGIGVLAVIGLIIYARR